jgi:hypothetical protein
MRTENDLRSALLALERETPDTAKVLRHLAERATARTAARGRRPGRQVLAGSAAAAAVIAIAVVAALLVASPRGQTTQPDASQSVPRYYMALVPADAQSYAKTGTWWDGYAVVKDRFTGRTVATVQPPRPYLGFTWVGGSADDRTFVLAATRTTMGSDTQPFTFFYARFNPADDAVALTQLALPGLPVSNDYFTSALSPGGTELAVAGISETLTVARITVYSLPSGAAKTWSANVNTGFPFANDPENLLSWSSTGSLDFGWIGSIPGNTAGVYLLNTNDAGGSLLADSREVFCPVPVRLSQPVSPTSFTGTNTAFLTPDGATLISGVPQPIPVGQRPPACRTSSPGLRPTMPELEEFSVGTGQATSVLYASHSHDAVGDVYWSNPSGSVLVVSATTQSKFPQRGVFGILTGSTFTAIPESSSPPLATIAF